MTTYTSEKYYQDMNKILYSPYFRALASSDHATGSIKQQQMLHKKMGIASKILENLGGVSTNFLEVLLHARAIASPPLGQGGEEILKEKFGYDKGKYALKIAQAIGLTVDVTEQLDPNNLKGCTQRGIVRTLDRLLDKVPGITSDMEQQIVDDITAITLEYNKVGVSNDLRDKLASFAPSPLQQAKIEGQRENMEKYIKWMETQNIEGDPVMHILGLKESEILAAIKKNDLNIKAGLKH